MARTTGLALTCLLAFGLVVEASATTVTGGSNKRRDCLVQLMTDGFGFPGGKSLFKGVTCADGDTCDGDGQRDGKCQFLTLLCLNQSNEALPKCAPPASVESISVSGKVGKGKSNKLDTTEIDAAIAALVPTAEEACTTPVAIDVPVDGPNNKGLFKEGRAKLKAKSKTSKGTDKDKYQLVCLPATSVGPPPVTTTTTLPQPAKPGAGLETEIVAAAIAPDGTFTVDFTLTDADGNVIIAQGSSTNDPDEARVRIILARLETVVVTDGGSSADFTKYVNYITRERTGPAGTTQQPTYDTAGTYELLDAATGLWRYTLSFTLPAGFPTDITHTVGLQVQRASEDGQLVANPLFNFVPDGSPVTTVREVTTTAQCNGCHNPLAMHGGGRREVGLCQLCHTDQSFDTETGNTIDLKHMVHRLHHGKEGPSIVDGPVGTEYVVGGHTYGEKINVCESGEYASAPCETDADCPGGTCTGESTAGLGFPRDIRDCSVCHSDGATVQNYVESPNVNACTGCHDNVNPGKPEEGWDVVYLPTPGTNHDGGQASEARCNLCHPASGSEFDASVTGAHTLETRSEQLTGINGEILTAEGAPGGALTITFRLTQDDATPITDLSGFSRVALATNGPSTDFGGSSVPLITQTIVGGGSTGTLTGPDGEGVFTYVSAANLPADAEGTWRVGMEARRTVELTPAPDLRTVNEAMQNPVLDYSVDGSEVEPRRTVVDIGNCGSCHGVFSETFSMHGNLRNQTDYCVICHNPNMSDFAARGPAVVSDGASPLNEPIHLKYMLHRIHTGEELATKPYIIYGFGSNPHEFSEVRFPGNRADCHTCHVDDSYELPLPSGVLPTALTEVDTTGPGPVEVQVGAIPAIQAACLACHSGIDAATHAATMTTSGGAEACNVCHQEGADFAVSEVHHEHQD